MTDIVVQTPTYCQTRLRGQTYPIGKPKEWLYYHTGYDKLHLLQPTVTGMDCISATTGQILPKS